MDESFAFAIQDHLELQRRNRLLEGELPVSAYRGSRMSASVEPRVSASVLEDTQEWVMPESPAMLEHEPLLPPAEELWSGAPAFDWGD